MVYNPHHGKLEYLNYFYSISLQFTIQQPRKQRNIFVSEFFFYLKINLYATHIFQRTSIAFLHYSLCIKMNINHLAFITQNKLAACFVRCQRAYLILYLQSLILSLYLPPEVEMQKLCPLLPRPLPVHSETYVSIHSKLFLNYSDLTRLKLL